MIYSHLLHVRKFSLLQRCRYDVPMVWLAKRQSDRMSSDVLWLQSGVLVLFRWKFVCKTDDERWDRKMRKYDFEYSMNMKWISRVHTNVWLAWIAGHMRRWRRPPICSKHIKCDMTVFNTRMNLNVVRSMIRHWRSAIGKLCDSSKCFISVLYEFHVLWRSHRIHISFISTI